MSNALTVIDHRDFLSKRADKLSEWAAGSSVTNDALIRYTLANIEQDDNLRECTPASIYLAVLACAVTGLVPGTLRGEAFLVPFGGLATFMPGYKGFIKQARRAMTGIQLQSDIVKANDFFKQDRGTEHFIRHEPALSNRGETVGAYAWAKFPGGQVETVWVDLEGLRKIQEQAEKRKPSPAWKTWPGEMQRKSATKRLCKVLPLGDDYFRGVLIEDATSQIAAIDMFTDGEASKVTADEAKNAKAFGPAPAPRLVARAEPKPAPAANNKPIEAKSVERPTPPPPSRGSASGSGETTTSASQTPSASASPPSPPADPRPTTQPTPADGPSQPSTSSASEAPTSTETSSSASGGFYDEDPVDVAPPPAVDAEAALLADFRAWLKACTTRTRLKAEKGQWRKRSAEVFTAGAAGASQMQDAYARREAELPE